MTRSVYFYRVVTEGYRSIQLATPFALDSKGLNLIKGINGAGKTSTISALVWCLYKINLNGTTNDKVQTWEAQRLPGYRGTRVVVDYRGVDGAFYRVARHLNFKGTTLGVKGNSGLFIYRNPEERVFLGDTMVGSEQHKDNQQEYINATLGVESKTFLNSILFGQRMVRIVSASAEEKRKLFEELFEVEWVGAANDKAKEKKAELTTEKAVKNQKADSLLEKSNTLQDKYKTQKELKETFEQGKAKRVAELKEEIADCELNLNADKDLLVVYYEELENLEKIDIETLTLAYDEAQQQAQLKKARVLEISGEIKGIEREIERAKQNKFKFTQDLLNVKETCLTCGAPIKAAELKKVKDSIKKQAKAEDEVEASFEKSLKTAKEQEEKATTEAELAKKTLEEAKEAFDATTETRIEISGCKQDIAVTENTVTNNTNLLQGLKAKLEVAEAEELPEIDLEAIKIEHKKIQTDYSDLLSELDEVEKKLAHTNWWITKAFGAGGLKSFVFSAMLNQLNVHIDHYATRLGLKCTFSIDLTKASKPFVTKCYMGPHEVDYDELSGGQKQLLDCVVSFAMHDLVNGIVDFNILILDEIFEGLDNGNIEAVFDLIRTKADEGKSVFVITHSAVIDSLGSKVIEIGRDENQNTYVL